MHEPYTNWVPGITVPKFSKDPLGDEGEITPGPDDLNPAVDPEARETIEEIKAKQRAYARRDDRLVRTVPQPQNPDLPPARLNKDPTAGDDPFVFDDVSDHVDELGLPGMENEPDTELRFETGDLFRF